MRRCGGEELDWSRDHPLLIAPGTDFRPSEVAKKSAPILGSIVMDETRRLRFSGIRMGSISFSCTTPETRSLWQEGDLLRIRRDSFVEQQSRIDALHAWILDGGSLGELENSR